MTRPRKILYILIIVYSTLTLFSGFLDVSPHLYGLSTIMGTVLSSSVLSSSILGTTTNTTTVLAAYAGTLPSIQVYISLLAIGLLIYLELTDPTYGEVRRGLTEVRKSWLSMAMLLVLLFMIIVASRVWLIISP